MAEEVSVPGGGRFRPNRRTYRQILASQGTSDVCMRAARSEGGKGRTMRPMFDGTRQKARVYAKDRETLGVMPRPHL